MTGCPSLSVLSRGLVGAMQIDDAAGFVQFDGDHGAFFDRIGFDFLLLQGKTCSPFSVFSLISGFIFPT